MVNLVITNNESRSIQIWEPVFDKETLTAPGAATYVKGTVLARKTVATAVAASAFVGTGDGTLTLATVVNSTVVPKVGIYSLICVGVVTNGGIFNLLDTTGAVVAGNLTLAVGAGASTVLEAAGLQFTVTDGSVDFALGDVATMTVAADGDVVVYDRAGAGGAQVPITILTVEQVFTGAGSVPLNVLITGRVRRGDLVVHGAGAVTDLEVDALRDFGVVASPTTQLGEADNQ